MNVRCIFGRGFFAAVLAAGAVSCVPSRGASVKARASDLLPPGEVLHRSMDTEFENTAGSHLRLVVKGIRPTVDLSQICYSIDDSNALAKTSKSKSNVTCSKLPLGQTTFEIQHKNMPPSAYVFVFHDENSNGKLDFTVFNVLVEKRESAAEGYAIVEDPNSTSADRRVRSLILLPQGESRLETTLSYERTAFEKFLIDQAWGQIMGKARASDEQNTTRNIEKPTSPQP
jgi:hypothetical protein